MTPHNTSNMTPEKWRNTVFYWDGLRYSFAMADIALRRLRETLDSLARRQETSDQSEREVSATEAERDSIKMKLAEFMADKVGQEFDAVISGVTERGMFVELTETHAEGMIRLSSLGDDYYAFDAARYRLVGNRLKKSYTLGDPIRVKLLAARVPERELDFALAENK